MLTGLSGSLLSHFYSERLLHLDFAGRLGEDSAGRAYTRLAAWWRGQVSQLGPASSIRAITEVSATPLARLLGFEVRNGNLLAGGDARVALVVGGWTDGLDPLWRDAVRAGIAFHSSWCLCINGRQIRLVDTRRTYSRAYLQFDLEHVVGDPRAWGVFWGTLRAEMFRPDGAEPELIAQVIRKSARHGIAVGRSLRVGVLRAAEQLLSGLLHASLRRSGSLGSDDLAPGLDESLTLVYRILFLMFAEARGLVPNWHPIYRDHYSIESLRDQAEHGQSRGLWESLQAISRLAHRGCRAGALIVPAFNGRLFSPHHSPMAASRSIGEGFARGALLALSTVDGPRGSIRTRIDYRDLGVEQLGAVYESVLEYVPAVMASTDKSPPRVQLLRGGDQRKTTGSYYTPQSITDYLVRRTLHPLVANRTAAEILQLRIVDPSMGSAAFLVAACRYLAAAFERALVQEGEFATTEIADADRARFRRDIAQRCLFGVDLNPAAVQLARLSLWLATLAAGKPLNFLDHHLACGDSLIGASPMDLARQSPPRRGGSGAHPPRPHTSPLFSETDFEPSIATAVLERQWMADTPDDSPDIVLEKEHRLERIGATRRWKAIADLWCACWMWPDRTTAPTSAVFACLQDHLMRGRSTLPAHLARPLLESARAIARSARFFHWMFEFPEAYFDRHGRPLANPGFDAVLGNPPWDMLRADTDGSAGARTQVRSRNISEKQFIRGSGVYRHQGGGHINRYQLFVERALMLTRRGGRIGLVLPSGFATDHTSAPLRRQMLEHCDLDMLAGLDNRRAIFPIHRSVRFVLVTATTSTTTGTIACRFGIDDPSTLDAIPDHGDRATDPHYPIGLTPSLIQRLTGPHLAIPDLRTARDLSIVERIVHRFPRLGAAEGWNARFGRELNATEDRRHFDKGGSGLPVLEGKHIDPFVAHVDLASHTIPQSVAGRLTSPARSFKRRRLAYRDVASSTNRLSLIAAVLPAGVVTTHSLFCLRTPLADEEQDYLCGILNSFVANYLVRHVMTTHLGSTTVEALRVPVRVAGGGWFADIVSLARRLQVQPSDGDTARLQALAARAYCLSLEDFEHVLGTFPLIPQSVRADALEEFRQVEDTGNLLV